MKKVISTLLMAVLCVSTFTANAQTIGVQKRKHLKGYNVEFYSKTKHVNDFRIKDGERVLAPKEESLVQQTVYTETPTTVVRPTAYSATVVESSVARVPEAKVIKPIHRNESFRYKEAKTGFFSRVGAGLVYNKTMNKVQQKIQKPFEGLEAQQTQIIGSICALLSFIFGIVSIIGVLLNPIGAFLAIPGIVLGIIGILGSQKGLALTGILLNVLAIVLVALI